MTPFEAFAEPIMKHLVADNVNEVCYNATGNTLFVEEMGVWREEVLDKKDIDGYLTSFARQCASFNSTELNKQKPILSGTLPGGERIQIVAPPCSGGFGCTYAFAIRKPSIVRFTLDDYENNGAYRHTKVNMVMNETDDQIALKRLFSEGKANEFVRLAIKAKKNIIISGGTGSGKTTYFNAMVREIDPRERLISIEDSREIVFPNKNSLNLLSQQNNDCINFNSLLKACLRLRPDRIMAAEVRGEECFAFLRAIATGHPGSITTIHADNPKLAFEQIYLMIAQAGLGLSQEAVSRYVNGVIDVVIQIARNPGLDDVKGPYISEIWYKDAHTKQQTRDSA